MKKIRLLNLIFLNIYYVFQLNWIVKLNINKIQVDQDIVDIYNYVDKNVR